MDKVLICINGLNRSSSKDYNKNCDIDKRILQKATLDKSLQKGEINHTTMFYEMAKLKCNHYIFARATIFKRGLIKRLTRGILEKTPKKIIICCKSMGCYVAFELISKLNKAGYSNKNIILVTIDAENMFVDYEPDIICFWYNYYNSSGGLGGNSFALAMKNIKVPYSNHKNIEEAMQKQVFFENIRRII